MTKLFQSLVLVVFAGGFLFGQTTLFQEDFANGVLQNVWYPGYAGNNMEVEFQAGNPSGDSWVGKLGNDLSGGNVGQSFSGDETWTDFYYEAQVYIPLNEGTYYGLEFRVDSTGNTFGYQFLARVSAATLRFRARTDVVPVPVIKEWTDAEIPGGFPTTSGWHKMAVKAIGNQFWFYFDDQELPGGPFTDDSFSSGWIGAYVWDFALSPIYLYVDDLIVETVTAIDDGNDPQLITEYRLNQNYPNPFNPSTTISFYIPGSETITVDIFNNLGQKVRTLVNGRYAAGDHQFEWDARNDLGQPVPAGVYYYRLQAGSFHDTKNMLLIK